jgi:hypothetical protein
MFLSEWWKNWHSFWSISISSDASDETVLILRDLCFVSGNRSVEKIPVNIKKANISKLKKSKSQRQYSQDYCKTKTYMWSTNWWVEHNIVAVRSSQSCSRSHTILVGYHTHFAPLPQPLTPLSGFFLHRSWPFLGIAIQPLEQLFTTWVACNLLECLFLHHLHPHSSPSSSMSSLAILGLHRFSIRSIVRLMLLCSFMGLSGKSAC